MSHNLLHNLLGLCFPVIILLRSLLRSWRPKIPFGFLWFPTQIYSWFPQLNISLCISAFPYVVLPRMPCPELHSLLPGRYFFILLDQVEMKPFTSYFCVPAAFGIDTLLYVSYYSSSLYSSLSLDCELFIFIIPPPSKFQTFSLGHLEVPAI